jgi:replication factor A1
MRLDDREIINMSEYEEETPIKIAELTNYSRKVYTVAKVISIGEPREVTSREDNSAHTVCESLIADDTGSVYLTLWDEAIDEIEEDMILKLNNAYVNVFRGSMRLNLGKYGSYEILNDAPFTEVELENNMSERQVEYKRRPYRRDSRRRF